MANSRINYLSIRSTVLSCTFGLSNGGYFYGSLILKTHNKMQIIKVSYERIFPLAPYVNEKIGFEATIDGSAESEKDALNKLKQIAEEWHKSNNPGINTEGGVEALITVDRTTEDERIAKLIAEIYSCTEIGGDSGLGSYWTLSQSNETTKLAYEVMRKKLVKKESDELLAKSKRYDDPTK